MAIIDYDPFLAHLSTTPLAAWCDTLPAQFAAGLSEARYGDLPRWRDSLATLPDVEPSHIDLNRGAVSITGAISEREREQLETGLRGLHPWRKGPFHLFGVDIDTEWRSDWKWQRVAPHIADLSGRCVLDVGCGSGYHCWRMRGAGAATVVGVDPTPLFICQFFALQHYIQDHRVSVLPMGIEQVPPQLVFDTVFSMGILYHRRSPFDHLLQLKSLLREGGELVLETLVIEGDEHQVLVPGGRYARMGNVWFIPSTAAICRWLKKVGFSAVRCVDDTVTTTEEQRSTDWMRFHSLQDFLDPDDPTRSIEGYPAPRRAVFVAERGN